MTVSAIAGGRFQVARKLGEGGMAEVFLARDEALGRLVAVKVLARHFAHDPDVRERFVREARHAARLGHPNVVAVFDVGEDDGVPFIVMEYVDGETLADVLERRGRLPAGEAVALAVQACSGLDHAHAAGLVHRDVKPGNLLVRPDGTLKIGDFGIARATAATSLTEAGTILGTAAYLSPEQAAGEEVTAAADLYALGSVLYELLTGRPSRTIDSLERLVYQADAEPIAPVRDLAPDVPTALEDVVMRTLARRPEHRPGSAAALARELEAALPDSVAPASDAVTEVLRSRHSVDTELQHGAGVHRPRHRWTPALVAAILVVAAIVVAILLVSGGDGGGADPARVEPVEPASDPEQQARNLAEWLREHS